MNDPIGSREARRCAGDQSAQTPAEAIQQGGVCPICGGKILNDAPAGDCPACLMRVGAAVEQATTMATPLPEPADAPDTSSRIACARPSASDRSPSVPRVLGDYELLEAIARGGMGIVYKARQQSLNRIVALKLLPFGELSGDSFVQRFRIEAQAAASLKHPNIVSVYEIGQERGQHFFSMEYVEGQNLAQLVRGQPLAPRKAAGYAKSLAAAIDFAHRRGILHRDLKPSNVLIDAEDRVRVTDFGLAKRFADPEEDARRSEAAGSSDALTLTGQVLGTPNYMAPEQCGSASSATPPRRREEASAEQCKIADSKPKIASKPPGAEFYHGKKGGVGPWSDVYGLGGILYFLLTARPPFQAGTLPETLQQVVHAEPVSPRLLNPSVPKDLETICLKCLEKEPSRRYGSAQDLAGDLELFLQQRPVRARPIGNGQRVWRWCRRHQAVALLAAALVVLLTAVAVGSGLALVRIVRGERSARANLYASDMNLIQQSIQSFHTGRAASLLDRHRPTSGQEDVRGFEWRYLWAQSSGQEAYSLRHPGGVIGLTFAPDGRVLAAISAGRVFLWEVSTRRLIRSWNTGRELTDAAFAPDGSLLAVCWPEGAEIFQTRDWTPVYSRAMRLGFKPTLRFNVEGTKIVAGSSPVSVWDFGKDDWYELEGTVGPAAVLPGGDRVAAVAADGVQLWDLANRRLVRRLESAAAHGGYTANPFRHTGAISPDGRLLAVGTYQGAVLLWEVESGQFKSILPVHSSVITHIQFLDNSDLITAANDQTMRILDTESGAIRKVLAGHRDGVHQVILSPARDLLASGAADGTLKLWELDRPAPLAKIDRVPRPLAIASAADRLLTFQSPNELRWIDLHSGAAVESWLLPVAEAKQVHVTPNQKWLMARTASGVVEIWDLESRVSLATIEIAGEPITDARLSRDRGILATQGNTGTMRFWRLPMGEFVAQQAMGEARWPKVGDALITQQGSYLNGWSQFLWNMDGTLAASATGLPDFARCATQSMDGQWLAFGWFDGAIAIWDIASRPARIRRFQAHHDRVDAIAFAPDSKTLASGILHGEIKLWQVSTGQELLTLSGHEAAIDWMGFSADGRLLASWSADGELRLWRAPSLAEIAASELIRAGEEGTP